MYEKNELLYENSAGDVIDLRQNPIWAQELETILSAKWDYATQSAQYGTGRISEFYRGTQEKSLKLAVMADDQAGLNAIVEKMMSIVEYDIRNKQPGRLWRYGSYMHCYIVAHDYAEYEELYDATDWTVKIVAEDPVWIEEKTISIGILDPSTMTDGKQYSEELYCYPYKYVDTETSVKKDIEHYAPFDFRLVAYGPAAELNVSINGHQYAVNYAIETGEYMVVDSREAALPERHAFIVRSDGTEVNVFNFRNANSLLLQKIEPGRLVINYNRLYGIDLTLFKRRNTPRWAPA